MNLVFLGPPGSGKGTQASFLQEKKGFALVGMGNILRDEVRRETPLGLQVKGVIERGLFPENALVVSLLKNYLLKLLPQSNIIFDGFPRDLHQAEALEEILTQEGMAVDAALYLAAEEDVLVQRILDRFVCASCGAVYALHANPPKRENFCDHCDGELTRRQDDQVSVFKERFRIHKEKEKPILDFYSKRGLLISIDALKPVGEVEKEIAGCLEKIKS
ncbi:MAG: adenylate kinase family protein [Alphaproteobacteria bacterium]